MVEVMRINKIEEMYGFHFADVDIMLLDYADTPTLSVKILLETLHSEAPALTEEESKRLYQAVEEDYMDIPRATDRRKAMNHTTCEHCDIFEHLFATVAKSGSLHCTDFQRTTQAVYY